MSIVFGLSGYCFGSGVWRTFDWLSVPHFKKKKKKKEERNEMKREAGFSFRHQASDLNPAGASKSLSMYHHHPAMFVFWFLANNVTQMHMLKNKRRWTRRCKNHSSFFVPLAGRLTFGWCGFSVDAAPSSSCERFTLRFLVLCVAAIMWCIGQTASKVQWHCIIQLNDLLLKWVHCHLSQWFCGAVKVKYSVRDPPVHAARSLCLLSLFLCVFSLWISVFLQRKYGTRVPKNWHQRYLINSLTLKLNERH